MNNGVPFGNINTRVFIKRGQDATLNDIVCEDLSVNGTFYSKEAIIEEDKTINGYLRVEGDASFNSNVYAKQMGVNVVNDEAYASGNNMLKVAGHMNIDNFTADTGSSTNTAQLVIGKVANDQYIKFKTEKTGTGIGASSIDFNNVNASPTDVNYLAIKHNDSQVGYINEDGKIRMKQVEVKIDSNDGTYMNFRDNAGDSADNDVLTFKSGIDSGEFPSAHFVDFSMCGDYSSNPTEIFMSTDKTKNSYLDTKSKFGINTRTPRLEVDISGDTYSKVGVFGNDGNLLIESFDSGGGNGSEAIKLQTYIDNNGIDDRSSFVGNEDRYQLCLQPDNGYVGIGTDDPASRLHIVNDANGDGVGLDYQFQGNGMVFKNRPDQFPGTLERRRIQAFMPNTNVDCYVLANLGTNTSATNIELFDGNMERTNANGINPKNNNFKGQRINCLQPAIGTTNETLMCEWSAYGNNNSTRTGTFKFYYDGDFEISGTFPSPSDQRYKENIVDANITNLISDFQKVRFVNFNMIDDETKLKKLGVLAQEIREIYPTAVKEREVKDDDDNVIDTKLSVKYEVLYLKSCLLVQHLLRENEAIKTRLTNLESQVNLNNGMLLNLTNNN